MEIVDLTVSAVHPRLTSIKNRNLALDTKLLAHVTEIIEKVRAEGDLGLCELTQTFDSIKITPAGLRVDPDLMEQLASQVNSQLIGYIRRTIENVRTFHEYQKEKSWDYTDEDGVVLGQRLLPLESVGLYVPGGKAVYPSTLIMNAVPAITAGVSRIVVTTPLPSFMSNPVLAATLKELGLREVYTVGGAQAVAALAYGTETIPRVDKIVGPGNNYVAAAKKLVYGAVDIDTIAGASEIVILADRSTPPNFVAADLLSQAEHDPLAAAILITTDARYAQVVQKEVERQLAELPRREIAEQSIANYGAIFLVGSQLQMCELTNQLAAEHVEVMTVRANEIAESIHNAGAIFVGPYSCESVGDYFAGPNHVLPTGGTARFSSPLGVYDFFKRINIIKYNKHKLEKSVAAIVALANAEGLEGHARAVLARFKYDNAQERSTTRISVETLKERLGEIQDES